MRFKIKHHKDVDISVAILSSNNGEKKKAQKNNHSVHRVLANTPFGSSISIQSAGRQYIYCSETSQFSFTAWFDSAEKDETCFRTEDSFMFMAHTRDMSRDINQGFSVASRCFCIKCFVQSREQKLLLG